MLVVMSLSLPRRPLREDPVVDLDAVCRGVDDFKSAKLVVLSRLKADITFPRFDPLEEAGEEVLADCQRRTFAGTDGWDWWAYEMVWLR